MTIVHVAPTGFGGDGLLGGGERYPLELARALAAYEDVELVTFGRHARRWQDRPRLRITVLRHLGRLRSHPAQPIAPQLPWALRRAGAHIVHTHQTRTVPSRLAALTARAAGRPLVTTDHGLGADPLTAGLYDRFLLVSEFSARTLHASPARTDVVYGGVDPARFAPERDLRRDGVLFAGRLTPHKGVDRLLRALPDGARLTVVGSAGHDPEPPERDYPALLRELARGRSVDFAGALPDAELAARHRQAAVFVLPSVERTCYGKPVAISELLGLSMLEAMASGTPVVASRLGGLPEVVRDGETGYLVTPGDVDELRARIGELLADRARAERMGRRGRELVLERFTWDACARRCLGAYATAAGRPQPSTAA